MWSFSVIQIDLVCGFLRPSELRTQASEISIATGACTCSDSTILIVVNVHVVVISIGFHVAQTLLWGQILQMLRL